MAQSQQLDEIQDKLFKVGQSSLSRLQNSVSLFQNEMEQMVKSMKQVLIRMPSENNKFTDRYTEFIKKLDPNHYQVQENYF